MTPVPQPYNVAAGKPAAASSTAAGSSASQAVDGDTATFWRAQTSSPPSVDFEVKLGGPHTVMAVELVVAQAIEGPTTHVVSVALPGGSYSDRITFHGVTRDGETIAQSMPSPARGVDSVRIRTTSSPSAIGWREVRIIGLPEASAVAVPLRAVAQRPRGAGLTAPVLGLGSGKGDQEVIAFTVVADLR